MRWLAFLMVLTGCTFSSLQTGMDGLIGKPASVAFSRFGYPQGETTIAGRDAYVWQNSGSMSLPATTHGTVGPVPFSAITQTPEAYDCVLRVFVDASDIIQAWDAQGDAIGCDRYAVQFR